MSAPDHAPCINVEILLAPTGPSTHVSPFSMLRRWASFTRFLDDGRLCLTNNAAERALRCIAVGRRNWTFAGSDRGGERAASIYTLLQTAKLNGVDPQAWLADVLARIAETPSSRLSDLLPWNWRAPTLAVAA